MSQNHISSPPRLLLFPQVARPEAKAGNPAIRRYSLTLLTGARGVGSGARPGAPKLPRL